MQHTSMLHEEGFEKNVLESPGGLLLALAALDQERQDLLWCDRLDVKISEPGVESVQKKLIILDSIFPPSSFSGTPENF